MVNNKTYKKVVKNYKIPKNIRYTITPKHIEDYQRIHDPEPQPHFTNFRRVHDENIFKDAPTIEFTTELNEPVYDQQNLYFDNGVGSNSPYQSLNFPPQMDHYDVMPKKKTNWVETGKNMLVSSALLGASGVIGKFAYDKGGNLYKHFADLAMAQITGNTSVLAKKAGEEAGATIANSLLGFGYGISNAVNAYFSPIPKNS